MVVRCCSAMKCQNEQFGHKEGQSDGYQGKFIGLWWQWYELGIHEGGKSDRKGVLCRFHREKLTN